MSSIAVVILNWNGKNLLEKFLPSVNSYSKEADIYVVDNGSSDDSISYINATYPEVKIISFENNYGFCLGYNKALKEIKADYYVLLNSDVEVTDDWLKAPMELLDSNDNIAACQPKIKAYNQKDSFEYAGAAGGYVDKFGFPFCSGRLFESIEKDSNQYETAKPILWGSGAALFIRSNVFHELDGLDSSFFAHMEEIDLCWRINNLEKEIWYTPDSVVYHVGGATLQKSNPRKTYFNFRNGLALLYKNHPKKKLKRTILIRLILDGLAGLYFLLQGNPTHTLAVLRAHFSFYGNFRHYKASRNKTIRTGKQLKTIYNGSIVYQHFIKRVNSFSELDF